MHHFLLLMRIKIKITNPYKDYYQIAIAEYVMLFQCYIENRRCKNGIHKKIRKLLEFDIFNCNKEIILP